MLRHKRPPSIQLALMAKPAVADAKEWPEVAWEEPESVAEGRVIEKDLIATREKFADLGRVGDELPSGKEFKLSGALRAHIVAYQWKIRSCRRSCML